MTPKRIRTLISLAFALLLLGGCAGNSPAPTVSEIWQNTQKTVSSAYEKAKSAVTSAYNRITDKKPEDSKPAEAKKVSSPGSTAISSPGGPPYTTDIQAGRLKPITARQVRGSGRKELHVIPRGSMTPKELRRQMASVDAELKREKSAPRRKLLTDRRRQLQEALQSAQTEETIVREMNELSGRLRLLQKKLEDVRKAKSGMTR